VPAGRRAVVIRDLLDAVRSVRPYVWKGGDVTAPAERPMQWLPPRLPHREGLSTLSAFAQPLVVALASQVPYLNRSRPSRRSLPYARDRAQDRNAGWRSEISARLTQSDVECGAGRAGAVV